VNHQQKNGKKVFLCCPTQKNISGSSLLHQWMEGFYYLLIFTIFFSGSLDNLLEAQENDY